MGTSKKYLTIIIPIFLIIIPIVLSASHIISPKLVFSSNSKVPCPCSMFSRFKQTDFQQNFPLTNKEVKPLTNISGCHNCIGKYDPCPSGYVKCYWCEQYDWWCLARECGMCAISCLECAATGSLLACADCFACVSIECPSALNECCKKPEWSCCEPP